MKIYGFPIFFDDWEKVLRRSALCAILDDFEAPWGPQNEAKNLSHPSPTPPRKRRCVGIMRRGVWDTWPLTLCDVLLPRDLPGPPIRETGPHLY